MLRVKRCAAVPGLAAALIALAPVAAAHSAAPAQEQGQDHAAKLEALQERWDKANEDFFAKYQAAETNDERRELMKSRPKPEDYLPEAIEIAEAAAGTEVAASAWMWVLQHADPQADKGELVQVAIEALLRDHLASPAISDLPMTVMYMSRTLGADKVEELLRDLMGRAPEGALKGGAMFALASTLDSDDLDPASERGKEVRALMEAVAKEYAEVKDSRGRSIGARAEGWIFEKDHLQVGKVAPDIEGTDLSGVAFKLSDYRGKVVLLDFWGNW